MDITLITNSEFRILADTVIAMHQEKHDLEIPLNFLPIAKKTGNFGKLWK